MADIGYPIIEAEPDGTFVITKHAGTGGRVTVESVKEQLLYEMGDPREYITPDCIADFTTHPAHAGGPDRVRFSGIRGRAATAVLQSIHQLLRRIQGHRHRWCTRGRMRTRRLAPRTRFCARGWTGWVCVSTRCARNFVGANACHGIAAAEPSPELGAALAEVVLRFGVRCERSRRGGAIHARDRRRWR